MWGLYAVYRRPLLGLGRVSTSHLQLDSFQSLSGGFRRLADWLRMFALMDTSPPRLVGLESVEVFKPLNLKYKKLWDTECSGNR